jgi:hypothetical protein
VNTHWLARAPAALLLSRQQEHPDGADSPG